MTTAPISKMQAASLDTAIPVQLARYPVTSITSDDAREGAESRPDFSSLSEWLNFLNASLTFVHGLAAVTEQTRLANFDSELSKGQILEMAAIARQKVQRDRERIALVVDCLGQGRYLPLTAERLAATAQAFELLSFECGEILGGCVKVGRLQVDPAATAVKNATVKLYANALAAMVINKVKGAN